jgi:hypothetical protein
LPSTLYHPTLLEIHHTFKRKSHESRLMTAQAFQSPDAPESNAGDDFHLLWASRRVLRMLAPASQLVAVSIEGPAPQEAVWIDPGGDQLLGIDTAEYYGDASFPVATCLIHSLLKYSTRHPGKKWTAARLAEGKDGGKAGSVIHRLSQVFHRYLQHYDRASVLSKLRVALVSNRPCDEALAAALVAAQRLLAELPSQMTFADLKLQLDPAHHEHLTRLKDGCVALGSREFCDFLRVLDLGGCGESARLDQEVALVREIAQLGFLETASQYNALKQLIHRRMMPGSRQSQPLTAHDVAAALGVGDRRNLFPCPPRFEDLERPVPREQLGDLAAAIVAAGGNPVCVHGGAGMAKTTISRTIHEELPAGSVVIVFDCYGGGSYLDPAEARHGHARAVMQVANDLAIRTGAPLLLHREHRPEELLRGLLRRLESAARAVQAASPGALVVILVDAADNSIAAAKQRGEPSFVPDLVRCAVPAGCRLVVTARTHRRAELGLPPNAVPMEIQPFSLAESRTNLTDRFPDASNEQVEPFHRLSNAIPRVQGYALKAGRERLNAVLDALRPTATVPSTYSAGRCAGRTWSPWRQRWPWTRACYRRAIS